MTKWKSYSTAQPKMNIFINIFTVILFAVIVFPPRSTPLGSIRRAVVAAPSSQPPVAPTTDRPTPHRAPRHSSSRATADAPVRRATNHRRDAREPRARTVARAPSRARKVDVVGDLTDATTDRFDAAARAPSARDVQRGGRFVEDGLADP